MTKILDLLTGWRWKIAGGAAALILLAAGFFLLQAQIENRHLVKMNAQLDARINAPGTGYVAQLAQATTNVETLQSALDRQNEALKTQAAESNQKLAELTATVDQVQRENQKLRAASDHILNGKPQGDTLVERITDIDNRLLETLK